MNSMRLILNKRGMHTAEYAICFGLVVAAVVGMQTFVKRSLQARIKTGTDLMVSSSGGTVEGVAIPALNQYEPYYADSGQDSIRDSRTLEKRDATGALTRQEATEQNRKAGAHQSELGADKLVDDDLWK